VGDAVEEFLIRAHIRLPEPAAEPCSAQEALNQPLSSFSATPARSSQVASTSLTQVEALSSFVQQLHAAGMSLRKIARSTVRRYVRRTPEPPLPTPRALRKSALDPYEDYLLERWSQGERNAARLYREISERGYPGCATMMRTYVAHLRSTTGNGSAPRSRKERAKAISPRALRWLLTRKREDLEKARTSQIRSAVELLFRGANCVCLTPGYDVALTGSE